MSSKLSNENKNSEPQQAFLEIAIFSAPSAQIAYTSSADRLELCAEGSSVNGGTTPSLSTLKSVITSVQRAQSASFSGQSHGSPANIKKPIPIYSMIRPRGGDFVYSDEEFELMKEQLLALKSANYHDTAENESKENNSFGEVSGFVFGILTRDNKVDRVRNAELVRLAAPLPCTFHRAFDEIITSSEKSEGSDGEKDMLLPQGLIDELEAVISSGFASILTSGGSGRSAVDGSRHIAALTEAARGRIEIIAGGGVRSTNIRDLRKQSPRTQFYHSSAIVTKGGQILDVADSEEVLALKRELMDPSGPV